MNQPVKIVTALIASVISCKSVQAQSNSKSVFHLGVGIETQAPLGKLHDISNIGLAITPRLQYDASKHFSFILTSGYSNYFGKKVVVTVISASSLATMVETKTKPYGIVPLKVGFKSFFSNSLYLIGEGGVGFETSSFGANEVNTLPIKKNTKLLLAPALGYASKNWDISLRYDSYLGQKNNFGSFGLRVAYGFGL